MAELVDSLGDWRARGRQPNQALAIRFNSQDLSGERDSWRAIRVAEVNARAWLKFRAGLHQRKKRPLRSFLRGRFFLALQQQDFGVPEAGLATPDQARGKHARIIGHQEIARAKPSRQIGHPRLLPTAARAIDHEQS